MKTKNRLISFFIIFLLTFSVFTAMPNINLIVSSVSPETDFTFNVSTRTITKYTGSGGIVEIPSTIGGVEVTSIGGSAFSGCTNLTAVTIPNSIVSIGISAFKGCTSLTEITIPSSVIEIGAWAFWGCTWLTSVTIESGVQSIKDWAFRDCIWLTEITIPDSVIHIEGAFLGCSRLTRAYFTHSDANTITIFKLPFHVSILDSFGSNYYINPNFKIIYPADATGFTTPTWNGYTAEPNETQNTNPFDGTVGIDYDIDDIIIYGEIDGVETTDYYINLTKETITVPSGYKVDAYSINNGVKWKAITTKPFDSILLEKLLNKEMTLVITNKYDKIGKKPAKSTDTITVVFPTVKARPKITTGNNLYINYLISADATGNTTGQWVLTHKNGTHSVKDGVQIAVADATKKKPNDKDWGIFYTDDESKNGINIIPLASASAKPTKKVYLWRLAPIGGATPTPASKIKKLNVMSEQKTTNYKIDTKKKIIKYKANTSVKMNGTVTSYTLKGDIDISSYTGKVELWINATEKKPATKIQELTVN